MKNIHILPTEKPTRLFTADSEIRLAGYPKTTFKTGKNICITNDEEIKEGWHFNNAIGVNNLVYLKIEDIPSLKAIYGNKPKHLEKIILTTDKDLIEDGVQPIPDEFLEWFVNNTSCEEVEVESLNIGDGKLGYIICKPQEEPKEETLEEAVFKLYPKTNTHFDRLDEVDGNAYYRSIFRNGVKWQQEQDKKLYSEEDMIAFGWFCREKSLTMVELLIKQFKNK